MLTTGRCLRAGGSAALLLLALLAAGAAVPAAAARQLRLMVSPAALPPCLLVARNLRHSPMLHVLPVSAPPPCLLRAEQLPTTPWTPLTPCPLPLAPCPSLAQGPSLRTPSRSLLSCSTGIIVRNECKRPLRLAVEALLSDERGMKVSSPCWPAQRQLRFRDRPHQPT